MNIQIEIYLGDKYIMTYLTDLIPLTTDFIEIPTTHKVSKGQNIYTEENTYAQGIYTIDKRVFLANKNRIKLFLGELQE
ncbi:MAG: hypothetical protein GY827_04850 [Cytophagales bacterium]|nr:hypothetical protein [Cytophagales bacterium]